MIDNKAAVMQQALDALPHSDASIKQHNDATISLQAAIAQPEQTALVAQAEPACSDHPDAPHGFDRNASHSADRYVCDCEGWIPNDNAPANIAYSEQAASESYDLIDRFLRNNLDDEDYAEFSAALDSIYLHEAIAHPTTVKAKPVAYREWVTKFGGGWEFYSADDMPAGNYASHRTLEALFFHPAVQPEQTPYDIDAAIARCGSHRIIPDDVKQKIRFELELAIT